MNIKQHFSQIEGLCIAELWRANNGEDSFVIPFATNRPVNIVFHGEKHFDYGHYGIHLGQEDRLVFLADSRFQITALFIDCRKDSATYKQRFSLSLTPSSKQMLCIPPGVAHTFYGLERVFTLNAYRLYLPQPIDWVEENTLWDMDGDIINIPIDIEDKDLPGYQPNPCLAADLFYQIVAEQQRQALPQQQFMHPETETVTLDDGNVVTVSFRQPITAADTPLDNDFAVAIPGLCWKRHHSLATGKSSGILPLLDATPLYVVDHGENHYSHDAYGIHTGQQDRLTFLGEPGHLITLHLVDCRKDSPARHQPMTIQFTPSTAKYLVIPPGVAHRFEHLEKIFTVNRPAVFVEDWQAYDSANDVIDWPQHRTDYPTIEVTDTPAPQTFYNQQVMAQKALMRKPQISTPIVLLTQDAQGNEVKLSMRKPLN